MTGQIPKYGKNFRLEQIPGYHETLAHRAYVLKHDASWFIRSDKTSERWQVFYSASSRMRNTAAPMGKPQPTLTRAMNLLLDGIADGFYITDTANRILPPVGVTARADSPVPYTA